MKKILLTTTLSLFASGAMASLDPIVAEYQKLDALQKTAPYLTSSLIALNIRTASACDAITSFEDAIKFEEVLALVAYVRNKEGFDDSEELQARLDTATEVVCQSLIAPMKPNEAVTELENDLKEILEKYAHSIADGEDHKTASKQLSADYAELRSKNDGLWTKRETYE